MKFRNIELFPVIVPVVGDSSTEFLPPSLKVEALTTNVCGRFSFLRRF